MGWSRELGKALKFHLQLHESQQTVSILLQIFFLTTIRARNLLLKMKSDFFDQWASVFLENQMIHIVCTFGIELQFNVLIGISA